MVESYIDNTKTCTLGCSVLVFQKKSKAGEHLFLGVDVAYTKALEVDSLQNTRVFSACLRYASSLVELHPASRRDLLTLKVEVIREADRA